MDATSRIRIGTVYRALDNVFQGEQDENCSNVMNRMMKTIAKQVRSGGKSWSRALDNVFQGDQDENCSNVINRMM